MGQSFTPEVIRPLKQGGCVFVRHGKGDHDIWYSPHGGTSFPFDHKILSRHTANGVLKQAGLPMQFELPDTEPPKRPKRPKRRSLKLTAF